MVEGNSEETFVQIEVRNPRTHISREKALYTDYEIVVKTNDIAFACNESSVRRRYSDFQWLRTRLITLYKWVTCPPELPPKRLFGRFQRQFLKRRQAGLQKFLERVVEDNQYLSDVAIHLFLQSSLPVKEIERYLDGMVSDGDILETLQSPGKGKQSGLSRSMAEIPHEIETLLEHDSGFCYSTTSSVNDMMHTPIVKTREDWRYFMSVPANLDKVNDAEEGNASQQDGLHMHSPLRKVDSGHMPLTESHQSLQRTARSSESDCDFACSVEYDADDEGDHFFPDITDDSSSLIFQHSQVLSIEQAIDILLTRPKISERIQMSDDTDEEFHESEYDVIDSENEDIKRKPRRKSTSSSKRKFSRSLSEVKLKRKSSRASIYDIKEETKLSTFPSMPNIRSVPFKKSKRKGGLQLRKLESHQEGPEIRKPFFKTEGFTTSSSLSKNRSDEADESFVPNSELDCYSTWSTPQKLVNGNVDSSEFEEKHVELKQRPCARSLFKRIISKREHEIKDRTLPVVSGRFRVSVIREEGSSSRRGSASSNEMTLRRAPFNENVCKPSQILFPLNAISSEKRNSSSESLTSLDPVDHSVTATMNKPTLSEGENVDSSSVVFPDGIDSGKVSFYVEMKEEESFDGCISRKYDHCDAVMNGVPSLLSLVKDALNVSKDDNCKKSEILEQTFHPRNSSPVGNTLSSREAKQVAVVEEEISGMGIDTPIQNINQTHHTITCDVMQSKGIILKDFITDENLFNVVTINGNIYHDDHALEMARIRATSPTSAVLKTYDVIPDVASGTVEDYEILSELRD